MSSEDEESSSVSSTKNIMEKAQHLVNQVPNPMERGRVGAGIGAYAGYACGFVVVAGLSNPGGWAVLGIVGIGALIGAIIGFFTGALSDEAIEELNTEKGKLEKMIQELDIIKDKLNENGVYISTRMNKVQQQQKEIIASRSDVQTMQKLMDERIIEEEGMMCIEAIKTAEKRDELTQSKKQLAEIEEQCAKEITDAQIQEINEVREAQIQQVENIYKTFEEYMEQQINAYKTKIYQLDSENIGEWIDSVFDPNQIKEQMIQKLDCDGSVNKFIGDGNNEEEELQKQINEIRRRMLMGIHAAMNEQHKMKLEWAKVVANITKRHKQFNKTNHVQNIWQIREQMKQYKEESAKKMEGMRLQMYKQQEERKKVKQKYADLEVEATKAIEEEKKRHMRCRKEKRTITMNRSRYQMIRLRRRKAFIEVLKG